MVWAVLDGTVLQGWPLLVATVVLPPRKTPELAGHVVADALARPNDHAAHWIRRGSSEQRSKVATSEIVDGF